MNYITHRLHAKDYVNDLTASGRYHFHSSEARGWDAPDKFVCADCVNDEFLKDCIQRNAEVLVCDYCGHQSDEPVAAPVETIMYPISGALFANFEEPGEAYLPRGSGDWVLEPTDTTDALESLPPSCHEDLLEDVESSFHSWGWVQCANGHWLGQHDSATWKGDWKNFERIVKTSTRYFFAGTVLEDSGNDDEYSSAGDLLRRIGIIAQELELYKTLEAGIPLYRAREVKEGQVLDSFDQLGPPPSDKASAGRMNPAGIVYLYLAREKRTAIGEALNCPPCQAAIATFTPKTDLTILDLAALPEEPSIFDMEKYDLREAILFLREFVHAISKPILKHGKEHVDYVPSQVVFEFFAQEFLIEGIGRIDGMVYPSAMVPGGQNVVIFPPRGSVNNWSEVVEMRIVEQIIAGN